ncbi:50S ribosomal protein L29 [Candidatus Wolfebacteria bacterium RIFCSPHIGHO2_01_FULL_48_22]|uniref:Large ribosomal subunit protein uL29 n=2 Tax=Candidatus Wolfeibacteriota TaxID=1752735 RepID=A0A1F8DQM8_9BACT|nr:MAG: 50S ribosomal protein L29 [Candidatus Wolfebacteria bacterium RIFCSPHIGHO2_01_FULL_48_22]OGM91982.1 MAG: 50S ribosomal protein L29 [Candidatus Wolfebacteria bacterium RIFCSPLOWO2_01_FULL_47_17b]
MKKDALEQIKKKDVHELQQAVADMKEKSSRLRFDLKSGKTANVKELRALRKDIATHLTTISDKLKSQNGK